MGFTTNNVRHQRRVYNFNQGLDQFDPIVALTSGQPVYASDQITFNLGDSALTSSLYQGYELGFRIEKLSPSYALDAYHNWEITNVLGTSGNPDYVFSKTAAGLTSATPPGYIPTPDQRNYQNSILLGGGRDYATSFFQQNPNSSNWASYAANTFGDYRVKLYHGHSSDEPPQPHAQSLPFQLRGLAITNLKSSPERIEVDGVVRQVTITGDITIYPNQATNGIAGWTPPNNIDYRIRIKSSADPSVFFDLESGQNDQWGNLIPSITPVAPNTQGIVGSFSVRWNGLFSTTDGPPYNANDTHFVEMQVEARAKVQTSISPAPVRNTLSPITRAGVWCKKCQGKIFNPFAEFGESINLFGDALSDLSAPINHSSSESSNPKRSMGYGWFSTESIKIYDINNDDTDLVYCDETGMCRRWLLNGSGGYDAVLADNKMTLQVFPSSPNAKYVVTWRDGSRREFGGAAVSTDPCDQYALKKHVTSNGHETTYTRASSYLAVSDGKGRTVYHHFEPGEVQPRVINDDPVSTNGRRYVLDYYTDGIEQTQLKSITDPELDQTLYVYDGAGRIAERREVRPTEGDRSVFYTYDSSGTGRLATMKVSSVRGSTPLELFQVTYSYNVPFSYPAAPSGWPTSYITTKVVTEDLMPPGVSGQSQAPDREMYLAYDSLGRLLGTFELALDDLDNDNQYDDPTWIATLHKYEDANDPWLRTETLQVNKSASTSFYYTPRGNLRRIVDDQENETLITYIEEDTSHDLHSLFPDFVKEIRRPAPDRIGAPTTFLPTTKFTYDYDSLTGTSKGNLIEIEDAEGHHTYLRYNSDGQINRIINRRGFKTYLVYDSRARLSEIHVQKSLAPSPSITELAMESAADFRTTILSYDSYDNITGVLDANGNTVAVQYDGVNRPELVTTVPEATPVSWGFDYLDRVLQEVTLPNSSGTSGAHTGRKATLEYDSAGRPLAVKRKDSAHTTGELRVGFAYDGLSQLRSLIRLKNGVERGHTAEYDRQGRTIKSTDAKNSDSSVVNPKSSTAAYEPFCVGFATTSARGVRRKASFDSLCRLTEIQVGSIAPNPLEVTNPTETRNFDYDDLGRLLETVQTLPPRYGQARFGDDRYGVSPVTRAYEYDSMDRVTKVTFEDNKTMEYLYDEEGNVTQVTENASGVSKVTQFSYLGDNRLHQVTYVRGSGNQVFTYAYDSGGRPLTLTYPASTGIVAHFSGPTGQVGWDGNGQLKHLRYMKGTDTIRRFEFSYDNAGNRISQLDVVDIASPLTQRAVKWEYGYDWLDRLESVKKAEAATVSALGALQLVSMYTYDAADNRVEFQVPNLNPALTETFKSHYDDADNLTFIEKKVGSSGSFATIETFTPDDDGNLKTRVSGGVTTTYTWTDTNRLAYISSSDGSKKQRHVFAPNGFRRQKKDKNNVETTEYAAGLTTAVAKNSSETVTYLMGHRLMGFEKDGEFFWFITDALSTVRDVVNSVGEVKARYEFAEYGARLAPSMTNTVESQKTFVGGLSVQDEVVDTGLMMMGHRFYNPQLGRFLNRDPIGFAGSTNLFEYSASSPVQYVDHQGLQQVGGDWISAVTGQPSVGPQPLTEGELRIYAGMMAMLNEPFDWVMTGEDIYENGFHPSHLLGLLPLVSYGVVQAANKYRRSRAVKAARDRAYVAENCNGFTRVQVSGFPGAHAMIQVQDDVLNFISVSRKGLGPGAGPELLKIALENADVSSVRRAVLRQILEADSLRALQEGFDPVGTRIYNTVRGPIQDVLGKTPTNVRAVRDGGVYNIEMDLK